MSDAFEVPALESDTSDFECPNKTIAERSKRRAQIAKNLLAKKQKAESSLTEKLGNNVPNAANKAAGVAKQSPLVAEQTQLVLDSQELGESPASGEDDSDNDNTVFDDFENLFEDNRQVGGDQDIDEETKLTPGDIDPYKDDLPRIVLRALGGAAQSGTEVEKMLRRNDPTAEDSAHSFVENLFTLVSVIVLDSVYTTGQQLKTAQQDALLRQGFMSQLSSLLIDTYLYDNLFKQCEGMFNGDDEHPVQWPDLFLSYVDECMSTKLTGTMKNRNRALKQLTEKEGSAHLFSQKIKTVAVAARREINNRLSCMWRSNGQLASGETSSALFDAIRHTCRERDAVLKAKAVLQRDRSYATPTLRVKNAEDYGKAVTQKVEDILQRCKTDSFTPSYWLTFCLLGPPADSEHQLAILRLTDIAALQQKVIRIDDEHSLNRYSRKTLKAAAQRSSEATLDITALRVKDRVLSAKPPLSTPSHSSTPSRSMGYTVTHEIKTSNPLSVGEAEEKEEKQLRDIITLYQSLGKTDAGEYVFQAEVTGFTRQLVELKLRILEDLRKNK